MSFCEIAYSLRNFIRRCSINCGQKKLNNCVILLSSLMAFSTFAAGNNEFNGDQQLLESCKTFNVNPQDANAIECVYYIKGFLAGVWHFDQKMAAKLEKQNRSGSSWEDRAYQYRVGRRGERNKPADIPYFCTPDNEAQERVIGKLSESLPQPTLNKALNTQIFNTLKVICPAAKTN